MEHIIGGVKVQTTPDGLVVWMSDWSEVDAMVDAGILRRVHRSGHGDPYAQTTRYYIP